MCAGEILALTDVCFEIVEFETVALILAIVMKANQLPLPPANGTRRYGPRAREIVREEAMDRGSRRRLTQECRQLRNPIEEMTRGFLDS